MRLAVDESGAGERCAVLVHGIMSDSRAWHRVRADLEEQGYRVIAVDLAGHGRSPRARRYSPTAWADDVAETVAPLLDREPDVIVGHSLGALVASIVAERLAARATIYVDPAFAFPRGARGLVYKLAFGLMPRPGRRMLARMNPKWAAEDVELETASVRAWDRRTVLGLADTRVLAPPRVVRVPSLVILAEKSLLITQEVRTRLQYHGMTVTMLPGSGHTVFRDDHAGFMRLVTGWLAQALPARI
ncbi:MAG: alpha/beta hydrolase [Microbacterium sp.]|uniref:alpha/beta fold hydrolase n=1 Tax=Microbacterium sp. TaxID=51671 RepID=UPI0039E2DFE8